MWPDASAQHQQHVRMCARVRRSWASSPRAGASEDEKEVEEERKVTRLRLEELQRLQANLPRVVATI